MNLSDLRIVILEEILSEIDDFNNIKSYDYIKMTKYAYTFEIDSNVRGDVIFTPLLDVNNLQVNSNIFKKNYT